VESVDTAALQSALDDWVAGSSSAGVSAAVRWADGSRWEGASGFADETAGVALTAADTMRVGSITKTYVAAAVLLLAEGGVLALDDPAARHLPDLGLDRAITIRHLLSHHSGLWNYTDDPGVMFADPPPAPEDLVAMSLDRRQVFDPGEAFAYSNTNYIVLGLVIEAVTGERVHRVLRDRVLEPLGLEETFLAGAERGTVTAFPYADPARDSAYAGIEAAAWTAGAMVAPPGDLVDFAAGLFGGDLLSVPSLDQMTNALDDSGGGAAYGLGVDLLEMGGRDVWGHGGGIPGFISGMFYVPGTGLAVAVTANDMAGGDLWDLVETLVETASAD
jgi:D-alanyl-D-alanine carboxypeptidase